MKTLVIAFLAALPLSACGLFQPSDSRRVEAPIVVDTPRAAQPAAESPDVTQLNAHTRTLIDASKLYAEAAGMAKVPAYAAQLRALSEARAAMVPVFQARVTSLGGDPDSQGGALGAGHMAFMELRSLVQDDTRTAVAEVLRGEKYLVDELTKTSQDTDVSEATRRFATAQLPRLQTDRNRVQAYLDTIESK